MAKTIDKIISKVRGNVMGRPNIGSKPKGKRIYDQKVSVNKGGYDKGGAYWGRGSDLRVRFTSDLSFIEFYRS